MQNQQSDALPDTGFPDTGFAKVLAEIIIPERYPLGVTVMAVRDFHTSGAVHKHHQGWIIGKNPLLNASINKGTLGVVIGYSPDGYLVVAFDYKIDHYDRNLTVFAPLGDVRRTAQ